MADHRECGRGGHPIEARSVQEIERDDAPRLLTDGGDDGSNGTESETTEDEANGETSDETEAEDSAEGDSEESATEEADDESATEEADDESATEEADEEEDTGGTDEETEDIDQEVEDSDEEADEVTEETAEHETDAEDEEPGEQHGIDAEEVYEGEDASGVLHLDLDGLFLDLLGLEVNLNEVTLDVSARPGENNLLGNLLSSVTGLLDGLGSPLESLTQALGGVKDRLLGLLPGFGGGEDEESVDDDEESSGGILSRIAGAIRRFGSGIVERLRGIASSIGGWFRRRIENAIMALPIEDLVAKITRTIIQQIVDRAESIDVDDVGMEEPAEAGEEVEAES